MRSDSDRTSPQDTSAPASGGESSALSSILRQVLVPVVLLAVVFHRWFVQSLWYLSADEYIRTLQAWSWAQDPGLIWKGTWPPGHAYANGLWLKMWPDLLIAPRMLTLLVAVAALVGCYQTLRAICGSSSWAPLLGSALLASRPMFVDLAAVPLTETWIIACVSWVVFFTLRYYDTAKPGFLWAAAVVLAIATTFRFEAWMLAGLWFLWIQARPAGENTPRSLRLVACIPGLFPIMWMISKAVQTGNPLSFFFDTKEGLTDSQYADLTAFGRVWALVKPFLLESGGLFAVALLLVFLVRDKYAKRLSILLSGFFLISLSAIAMSALLGGFPMFYPVRLNAPHLVMLILAASIVLGALWSQNRLGRSLVLVALIGIGAQSASGLTDPPDPVDHRMYELGFALQDYLARESGNVLIEKEYWTWAILSVFSGDPDRLVMDREDGRSNMKPSALLERLEADPNYLRDESVSLVLLRSRHLAEELAVHPHVSGFQTWWRWASFQVGEVQPLWPSAPVQ